MSLEKTGKVKDKDVDEEELKKEASLVTSAPPSKKDDTNS